MVTQENETVRITEGERTQENAFDKRKDGGSRADTESESQNDGQGEAGRFAQLTECEA
jgi:hypothetical protein